MELAKKVAEAVHVLNHDTQSCNRVAANQWLIQFQQTHAAWDVATAILTADRRLPLATTNFEVEFFATQILKTLGLLSLFLSLVFWRFVCCLWTVCYFDFVLCRVYGL